ncbi:hypothetical protein CCACVL1_17198 [Corchorus capsularis]|uniref:Uncharacterized protein n=1 Tax=Corchorus capsularis TaxID=210143 RepID=A0A1R3HTT5_COCAP|nr:hypothetical protein CCACVL1_17198 [Corchorus capsularis]
MSYVVLFLHRKGSCRSARKKERLQLATLEGLEMSVKCNPPFTPPVKF